MATNAGLSRATWRYIVPQSDTPHGDQWFGRQPRSDLDVGIVDVSIVWLSSESNTGPRSSDENWPGGPLVVQRVMTCGFLDAAHKPLPIPESSGRDAGKQPFAAHAAMEAFDQYLAKNLVAPAWKTTSEHWVTPVCEDIAAVADRLGGLQAQWHELVLGKPIRYLAGQTPLTDIATELPLLGDKSMRDLKLVIQVSGILLGLTAGQPLLANACLKSFGHDILLATVSKVLGYIFTGGWQQVGTRHRGMEIVKGTADLTSHTSAVNALLTIRYEDEQELPEQVTEKPDGVQPRRDVPDETIGKGGDTPPDLGQKDKPLADGTGIDRNKRPPDSDYSGPSP